MRDRRSRFTGLTAQEAVFVIEYLKDFAPRRAAEASGYPPDEGYQLIVKPEIKTAINLQVSERLENVGIDAEWLLFELVDNHRIARQMGNIGASNSALATIAKHVSVDALAKVKVDIDVKGGNEMVERILRGRERANGTGDSDDESFL